MKANILGVGFDCVTRENALERLVQFLQEGRSHLLVTPNPEMVMLAQKDADLMRVLEGADLVIPDGIGIVIASRIKGRGIRERVAGCDLIDALFAHQKNAGCTAYFLGGKPGVAARAKQNIEAKYPGIQIVGTHDGYFDEKEERLILSEIRQKKPDILLVGMSMGKQEKWLARHKDLPVKIGAGVGGTLDIMAGTVKRAPKAFQALGLEWFYRLLCQPSRAGRMLQLPAFLWSVLWKK